MILLSLFLSQSLALTNGEYLFRLGGCLHCHTENWREPLAGGERIITSFGDFYPPNISPDIETGIGSWSFNDFKNALHGRAPDGSLYYPAFPYPAYSQMTESDMEDLFSYIKSLKPYRRAHTPHELRFPYDQRWLLNFWRALFGLDREKIRTRGAYLVEAVAHCTECHTPRNSLGGLIADKWMSGGDGPVEGRWPPNITPDLQTGLGRWTIENWNEFLVTGHRPSGQFVGGPMAWVIYQTVALSVDDRIAVAQYMMALKPVHRRAPP